jgi:ATP-binding cassette subfamily F protein 3
LRILSASQLRLLYGEVEIFNNIDLDVNDSDRIGIVGPNGGGKTTLLRILVGELEPNGGTVSTHGGIRVGYVPQRPAQSTNGSLKDEVMTAFDKLLKLEDGLASSALEIQQASDVERRQAERKYSTLLQEYEHLGGYDYQNRLERVVEGIGLPQAALETPVSAASGGERTRAALAKALLTDPDLLVLDEPTNYLDFKGLNWLESFLGSFSHAFVVVSHDRYFLDQVVNKIWELDNGRLQSFPGNYSKYRVLKAEQLERQRIEYERQQEFLAKEEAFIERYRAGQKSQQALGREKRLERLERHEAPQRDQQIRIASADATRTGLITLRTFGLEVGFREGENVTKLMSVPDVTLERGHRSAIIGSNGMGKTTLLKTILGETPPLSGKVELGYNVDIGYFSQGNTDLPEDSTVLDAFLDAKNLQIGEARNYLARFLFREDDVYKPVSALSGGERSRLSLARLLINEPNVLVLDEPTTHLDIPSREALEQVLLSYNGTLMFVSHDRRLISTLAQELWLVEDGSLNIFRGTFDDWVKQQQSIEEAATRAKKPPARKRAAIQQKALPKEPAINQEAIIAELEARLAKIEKGLQTASEKQNVSEVARLGEEYNSMK